MAVHHGSKVEIVPIGTFFSERVEAQYKIAHPNRTKWTVELRITQDSFLGNFSMLIEYDSVKKEVTLGSDASITLDELEDLTEKTKQSEYMSHSISMDGDDDYSETITLTTQDGNLWLDYDRNIEQGGFYFKLQISKPVMFLESLWEQVSAIVSKDDEDEEDEE